MLVDTHGHLNFNAYKDDSFEVFKRTRDGSVAVVMPGAEINTSRRAVRLAEEWNSPLVWAAVGLHPIHLDYTKADGAELPLRGYKIKPEIFNRSVYEALLQSPKTVAIGEIGLDYWRKPKSRVKKESYIQKQKEVFQAQLDMAYEHKKPVLLHCRIAHDDMLNIVRNHPIVLSPPTGGPGIVHSYTGSLQQMQEFVELGFCIAFNALIFQLDFLPDVVRATPLESIVLETDAPYLKPPQAPGERNEPINVLFTAQKISELKHTALEDLAHITTKNVETVLGIAFEAQRA